jgi:hypothetical protein
MKKRHLHFKTGVGLLSLAALFWLDMPASAQSVPAQNNRPVQDNDTTRQELARFDQFLDGHREIAEQLRKDPSLVNNGEFVKNHPELETYLQEHPGIREEIKENPNAFMRNEARYDRRDDNRDRDINRDRDTTRQELARFDQFLDRHRETAEQLRKDPSLVNNGEFVKNHPELETYLQEHPGIREEIKENPNAFMRQEDRFDRREDNRDRDTNRDRDVNRDMDNRDRDANRDRDINRDRDANHNRDSNREELANFDRFLDRHRETAEQLRKDPSLVKNEEFVKNHPELETYLQEHPGVRKEIKENPNAFMQEEARYDHREDGFDRDHRENGLGHDADRDEMHRHFGEFLGGHSDVAQRLSKDPSLVKNQEFIESHPELKEYLNAHPEVRQQLMANPQSFVKSSQEFTTKTPTTTVQPKPKQ